MFLFETIRYVISSPETRPNCEGDISGDSEHRKGNFTEYIKKPPAVTKIGNKEIWWNTSINLPTKVEHKKPDIVIWDIDEKTCAVVETSAPLDTNISARISWKENVYIPLNGEVKRIYREYKFETISIVVGAQGAVTKQLTTNLKRLNFKESRTKTITRKLQKASLLGSMTIAETFMAF